MTIQKIGTEEAIAIIKRSKHFSARWYLRKYPDVRQAKVDPARHYAVYGWKGGRNPSSTFSTQDYLELYEDAKSANMPPLVHYELYGKAEKRKTCKKRERRTLNFNFSLFSCFTNLRSWFYNVYFNFHYLPFKQAVKLPIVFHKPRFVKLKGKVVIEGSIRKGMIRLGENLNSLYPDNGISFENHGGEIIFRGPVQIGGNSAISVGAQGRLDIGKYFFSTTGLKMVCYHRITIEESCRCGWEVLMMDTGFHRLKDMEGNFVNTGYAPITLGHHTWISTRCMVMPGAQTSPYTILAAGSMLNKKCADSHVLMAGSPAAVKKKGVWRDFADDKIVYPEL